MNYENKYLKYKNKYLKLQNLNHDLIGGDKQKTYYFFTTLDELSAFFGDSFTRYFKVKKTCIIDNKYSGIQKEVEIKKTSTTFSLDYFRNNLKNSYLLNELSRCKNKASENKNTECFFPTAINKINLSCKEPLLLKEWTSLPEYYKSYDNFVLKPDIRKEYIKKLNNLIRYSIYPDTTKQYFASEQYRANTINNVAGKLVEKHPTIFTSGSDISYDYATIMWLIRGIYSTTQIIRFNNIKIKSYDKFSKDIECLYKKLIAAIKAYDPRYSQDTLNKFFNTHRKEIEEMKTNKAIYETELNKYNKELFSRFCILSAKIKDKKKIPDSLLSLNICLKVEFDIKMENGKLRELIYVPDIVNDYCEEEEKKEIICFSAYLNEFMKNKWKTVESYIDNEVDVITIFKEACEPSC
jgi:hypothetical protein